MDLDLGMTPLQLDTFVESCLTLGMTPPRIIKGRINVDDLMQMLDDAEAVIDRIEEKLNRMDPVQK